MFTLVPRMLNQPLQRLTLCPPPPTDFPRPPRNLRLVEEVPGTVTLQWDHTPDLGDDEGGHYVILKRDASTPSWFTTAECVYSNKYTVTGLLPGRKYYFRVLARNSIGDSDPLDSRESLIIAKEKGLLGNGRGI